jgi:DNA primase
VQKILAGARQPYFNHVFRPDADDCVIVEGAFDAESWGQWGVSAIALCGVSVEDEGMSSLRSRVKRVKRLCVALDADEAGAEKREKVAAFFGATTRLIDYTGVMEGHQ